jgi:NDP-sugar pyrophosphorylase family protein
VKVVILAGGMGSRLTEEAELKPKPMVEVGGRPLLWHIMRHYAAHDFKEFFIALGYRGEAIKRLFVDYSSLSGSLTIHLQSGNSSLEIDALEKLAGEGEWAAYQHQGFWQCMDNPRDKRLLESLWQQGNAPWTI